MTDPERSGGRQGWRCAAGHAKLAESLRHLELTVLRTDFLKFAGLAAAFCLFGPPAAPAHAQATSRPCGEQADERPGPACLLAHEGPGALPSGALYWNIYVFADMAAADRVRPPRGVVANAFGKVWLFDVAGEAPDLAGGRRVARIGPLPLDERQGAFSAEYLKSTFTPGMSAPVHVHSGPEAFYGVTGASCLETPDGVQVARGEGHALMVRRGPPMLLKAIGADTRRGFALILHQDGAPATTLTADWTPKGLCPAA